jgi:hypothetical protein
MSDYHNLLSSLRLEVLDFVLRRDEGTLEILPNRSPIPFFLVSLSLSPASQVSGLSENKFVLPLQSHDDSS